MERTRLAVFDVVARTAQEGYETTARDMMLSADEVRGCLRYCANLVCVQDGNGLPFCHGCRLAQMPRDQITEKAELFVETGDPEVIDIRVSIEEHESDLSLTWLVASEQLAKVPATPDSPPQVPLD